MKYTNYYNQYKDKIYSYFYYNLKQDEALSDDLCSETFLKAFKNFDKYNDDFAFSTWIYTIAKRTLFNHYKKEKISVNLDEVSPENIQEFMSYEEDIGKKIDSQKDLQNFYKVLEKLSPAEKEIIVKKYIEDYSTKEISEKYGKTEVNVRKILSRGMEKVKKMLGKN